ncbi:hypothetical protein EDB80DRAFT_595182 [Ilyonectria destructans]|nr:hypothetical protein EDB80DRAFT_595182 [Ilyonectria destructans]
MTSVTTSKLNIFNPASRSKATDTFRYFNHLPCELRWKIWELELCHERLLHVQARPPPTAAESVESTDTVESPRSVENADSPPDEPEAPGYELILVERQPISKLARVNSESRHVTSRFYRVQLPCLYRWEGKQDMIGTFYFHPELDTLEIRGRRFPRFAQDLWAHDPRHVGLINLALNENRFISDIRQRRFPELKKDIPKRQRALLRQIIPRLKRVIFLIRGGPQRKFIYELRKDRSGTDDIYLPRPIMAAVPKFDRLPCDPRSSVEPSLTEVHVDVKEPRRPIRRWSRLLQQCNVQLSHKVEYRFMVAFGGRKIGPSTENDHFGIEPGWLQGIREREAEKDIKEPFQEVERPLEPAVGFWLFPIEAIGYWLRSNEALGTLAADLRLDDEERRAMRRNWRKIDLSRFKPELCLAYLP